MDGEKCCGGEGGGGSVRVWVRGGEGGGVGGCE